MLVQEQNIQISVVLNKIFSYLNSNLNLKKDLDDYYGAIGLDRKNKSVLNNYTINYIFERRLGKDKKSIFDYAILGIENLSEEEKNIINALRNSVDGVFEVRKITRDKFELFNIVNEKLYSVKPMEKMVKFRNLSVGHFLLARIITLNNEHFLYHITDHITYSNRITAFQVAVSRLAQNPALFYKDNLEKLDQIKRQASNLEQKFQELFETNSVVTSNKLADSLIEAINDYVEDDKKTSKTKLSKLISPLKNSQYFDIKELQTESNLFLQAQKGFSAQNKEYNVTLVADKNYGLQVVPFMDIFLEIIERDDYKEIKDYEKCVKKFVQDSQITPLALYMASEKYPDKFLQRINEILKDDFKSIDEILHKYKSFYLENPYASSTITLYSSYAFKKLINAFDENNTNNQPISAKVGRNDACPCGSGLKYKKCCGLASQI